VLTLGLTAFVAVGLNFNIWASGAQKTSGIKERVIEKLYLDDSPVVVADLKVSGKIVKFGDKFDEDKDWLRHLSIKVKNNFSKPITFVQLDLDFPETKATGNIMAFPIWFGRNPRARVLFGEPKTLVPQETADIALSEDDYIKLTTFLEQRHPIESISKVSIRITEVVFEDGLIWLNGSWVRPDPSNPNKFIPADNP